MGITGSRHCKENLKNPDFLTVVTLSDSLVQRLPLDFENSTPLEREAREQNIDDFWKDRMECLENTYMESMGLSEQKFNMLEKRIIGMSPPLYKPKCPLVVGDLERCMSSFPDNPLKCDNVIKKLLLCIDTTTQDDARKACLRAARELKKKKCAGK